VQDDRAAGEGWQSGEPPSIAAQEHHQQLHGGVGRAADHSSRKRGRCLVLGSRVDRPRSSVEVGH
jgi:hypothetical protein